jgi:PAS domain S-box-containing protein
MSDSTHLVFRGDQLAEVVDALTSVRPTHPAQPERQAEAPSRENESVAEAEAILRELADAFSQTRSTGSAADSSFTPKTNLYREDDKEEEHPPNLEAKYRALLEQIPAVVFMAYLDRGIGEAYVSPEIQSALGYSSDEWLEDPVRWYERIHPEDKHRWSTEAAEMFLTGNPLRSAYRIVARDGRVVWFQCDARMMRREDGRPWFIHGVAFDISDLKHTEKQLQEERNMASAILNTVGALVLVLDKTGQIIRFNRACEQTTGYLFSEVCGRPIWDFLHSAEEIKHFESMFREIGGMNGVQSTADVSDRQFESNWITRDGACRLIAWSTTILPATDVAPACIIASGIDITERKRLEKTILDISAREQRRIGQDLHDGLGQHLTGIAFMAKVQEQKLAEKKLPEAADAAKVVQLVNDAISRTRELAKGLAPVVFDSHGLMSALQLHAAEIEDLFGISCQFHCDPPVLIPDGNVATHLYHIAQEAVTNAVRHGRARNILIRLSEAESRGTLLVRDDGQGLVEPPIDHPGMGLQIMRYRADMICGTLELRSERAHGTSLTCKFPLDNTK